MSKTRPQAAVRTVSIEFCQSVLHFVASTRSEPGAPPEVHMRTLRWRDKAANVHSEIGLAELAAAMKRLVAEEKLGGTKVHCAISGDFCVTRVMTGTNERVRHELAQLEVRSQRYLSLGPGEKAMARCLTPIDARHQHALLTVANQKTIDALQSVAAAAGIEIELAEPSLVAICRVVGHLGHDAQAPIMVIDMDERGVDLGISYKGQLLLDYRPGGQSVHDGLGDIISQHMARLQRYCSRFVRFASGDLKKIYLCGSLRFVQQALESFEEHPELRVEVLNIEEIEPGARYLDGVPTGDLAPAIGTGLVAQGGGNHFPGPNLIAGNRGNASTLFSAKFYKLVAPLAAVLLIAAGMGLAVLHKTMQCDNLQAEVASLESVQDRAQAVRAELQQLELEEKYLADIRRQANCPPWHQVLEQITRCLPTHVWLERFQYDNDGNMGISGACTAEGGVFEFASWLDKAPKFDDVAVEGTRPSSSKVANSLGFQLKCRLASFADSTKEAKP